MNTGEIKIYCKTCLQKEFGYEKCIETSISWVLLCKEYVFKIKKPVNFGFLDYSSLSRRKEMCENEVVLNSRFTSDVYEGVVTVRRDQQGEYSHKKGYLVDYAVKMKKIDNEFLLSNILAKSGALPESKIVELARTVATIHNQSKIVPITVSIDNQYEKICLIMDLIDRMNDIGMDEFIEVSNKCIQTAEKYLHKYSDHFSERKGAIRDCHGDMHGENIFVLQNRIEIIDCIEYKDDYRFIDVLDDFSAVLIDFECYGNLSDADLILKEYSKYIEVSVDSLLISYYKLQRAVTRFSVNIMYDNSDNHKKASLYLNKIVEYSNYLSKLV